MILGLTFNYEHWYELCTLMLTLLLWHFFMLSKFWSLSYAQKHNITPPQLIVINNLVFVISLRSHPLYQSLYIKAKPWGHSHFTHIWNGHQSFGIDRSCNFLWIHTLHINLGHISDLKTQINKPFQKPPTTDHVMQACTKKSSNK